MVQVNLTTTTEAYFPGYSPKFKETPALGSRKGEVRSAPAGKFS